MPDFSEDDDLLDINLNSISMSRKKMLKLLRARKQQRIYNTMEYIISTGNYVTLRVTCLCCGKTYYVDTPWDMAEKDLHCVECGAVGQLYVEKY